MSEFEKENSKFADDLDWLAFCYVANELTGEPLARFEARLAMEQEPREAVARAMELTSEVYLSGEVHRSEVKLSLVEPVSRNWTWQTAALILLGLSTGAWWWSTSGNQTNSVVEVPGEALAVAWVDSLDDSDWSELELELKEELGFDEEPVNEWMLAALSELEESELEMPN